MTDPVPMRLTCPADLLALVPYVLGFHPEDSLVLCSLGAGGVHARVDLEPDPAALAAAVDALSAAAARNRSGRVALVAYSDDHELSVEAVDRATLALGEHGVEVVEAIRADGARVFALTGCGGPCCPAEGTPYDLGCHPYTAALVLEGRVSLASRQELAGTLVGEDPGSLADVARAAEQAAERLAAAAGQPTGVGPGGIVRGARRHLVEEGHWVLRRVGRFLRTREPLDADEAGRMVVALSSVEVRDVAWSQMTRVNAERHVDLWRDLLRRTPPALAAAPAALLGFAAWLSGDGALAWCAVDRCQQAEPDYSMAALLTQALAAALPPTTWTPFPPEELPLFAG